MDLSALRGSGPGGAVLVADVPAVAAPAHRRTPTTGPLTLPSPQRGEGVGTVWRIMAERMTASWTTAPHFYLVREVNVTRLVAWLATARKQTGARITYSDLLVKLVAATLAQHPRVNVSWKDGALERHAEINIGLAVALEDGLVVPVIPRADTLGLKDIATRREDLVARAQAGKLRPADIQGGVFTISNLGMYGVDAFSAIVNPAAGRDPGRRPHRRSRGAGERPARGAADHDAHAVLRPPCPRRRPRRPVPGRARGLDRGAPGPANLRPSPCP